MRLRTRVELFCQGHRHGPSTRECLPRRTGVLGLVGTGLEGHQVRRRGPVDRSTLVWTLWSVRVTRTGPPSGVTIESPTDPSLRTLPRHQRPKDLPQTLRSSRFSGQVTSPSTRVFCFSSVWFYLSPSPLPTRTSFEDLSPTPSLPQLTTEKFFGTISTRHSMPGGSSECVRVSTCT